MTKDRLENEYFEWLCNKTIYWKNRSYTPYRKVLQLLHSQDFYYLMPMDDNRYVDGISLRYLFGEERGYSDNIIASLLDDRDCSVLEMMVALSNRCEIEIMAKPNGEDNTGYWFWCMMASLGLNKMTDDIFDKDRVMDILHCFLERQYDYNGKGGLFTLKNPKTDLRKIEIWSQLMCYLNEREERTDG